VQRWPTDHLVLVLDNVSYHKTTPIRAWLAAHTAQITIFWLPTYSPHLNRIERVWRFLKGKLACHRFWHDRTGLIHATNHLLHHVHAQYIDDQRPHLALDQNFRLSA
jgi:transposase